MYKVGDSSVSPKEDDDGDIMVVNQSTNFYSNNSLPVTRQPTEGATTFFPNPKTFITYSTVTVNC